MRHANAELITRFYQAFQQLDAETMASCYAEDVRFSDPVFTDLRGRNAGDMWRMLCAKAQGFTLTFEGVAADEYSGRARWIATYTFSQTGNTVVNHIEASFVFRDGKIVEHHARFALWRWASRACCWVGPRLCRTPFASRRPGAWRLSRRAVKLCGHL
jgi:ketosteroid isomerase-like protein